MRTWALCLLLLLSAAGPATADPCCLVPDNGTGTADLPVNCLPNGYIGALQILEGLPPNSSLDIDARLTTFVIQSQDPGGTLGGTREVFTATMILDITGAGDLSGFLRTIHVPVTGEIHTAPRTPGDAVQSFDFAIHKIQGIRTGDYDFALIWFEGGGIYGLPCSGNTILARQGPPGADFAVESSFTYFYRIQFEGRQESEWLEGWRGITLDVEDDFAVCPNSGVLGIPAHAPPIPARASANPFRDGTTLSAVLPESGPLRVTLHDLQGRRVRVLADGPHPAGEVSIRWDGRDASGRPVPAGVYLARMEHPTGTAALRLIRLR